ncbi:MAG: hypothetical protein IPH75_10565 [bacterium]|nr:hypothetical protein [bacterium]
MKLIARTLFILMISASAFSQETIVIGWNDLGMHCSNKDFTNVVVLPPFNNVRAQVIQVGDSTHLPVIMTTGFRILYEIPGNTFSVGKTNFWDFEDQIFGVNLPPDVGLTGNRLSGEMVMQADHFDVTGVPITPYSDADLLHEDPFQLGLLRVFDGSNNLIATTQPVVPVSNEINCVSSGCHSSEQDILNRHEDEGGFDPNNTPILCASCHSSNALGTPGHPGVPSLSEAIHKKHGEETNDCYKCHPGPNTQCLRDVMKTEHGFTCQTCHGSVTEVGESISAGREPWLEEPRCGASNCHGSTYSEEPGKLYRESRGHGGLFCSACHGEPHAIVPSGNARDNVQNIALQGYAGTLNKCAVCHGVTPTGAGPHGISGTGCCIGTRGNVNVIGSIDLSDLSLLIAYLVTTPRPTLPCPDAANLNATGSIDLSDLSLLIVYLTTTPRPTLPACP